MGADGGASRRKPWTLAGSRQGAGAAGRGDAAGVGETGAPGVPGAGGAVTGAAGEGGQGVAGLQPGETEAAGPSPPIAAAPIAKI